MEKKKESACSAGYLGSIWVGKIPWRREKKKKNSRVSCHFLLQGLFPTQGWNLRLLCLLHWQTDSLALHHVESPALNYASTNPTI